MAAPSIKLYYFQSRGLAEVARQILYIGAIKYEDVRISKDDWPKRKSEFLCGQVPVLEVDGVQISQSQAIYRFLAKRAGLYGNSDLEQALIDSAADIFKDHYLTVIQYYIKALGIYPDSPEVVEKLKQEVVIPAKDKFFEILTKFLEISKTGFIAGGELSFADLIIAEHVSTIQTVFPDYAKGFPLVEALVKKVHATPKVAAWLEIRPKTPY